MILCENSYDEFSAKKTRKMTVVKDGRILFGILVMPKWFLMIPWHRCHSCRLKLDL